MSLKYEILNMLANSDSEYMSGQLIANKLKVSRTAVWKTIAQLKSEGYIITTNAKKGYFMQQDSDIILKDNIYK